MVGLFQHNLYIYLFTVLRFRAGQTTMPALQQALFVNCHAAAGAKPVSCTIIFSVDSNFKFVFNIGIKPGFFSSSIIICSLNFIKEGFWLDTVLARAVNMRFAARLAGRKSNQQRLFTVHHPGWTNTAGLLQLSMCICFLLCCGSGRDKHRRQPCSKPCSLQAILK